MTPLEAAIRHGKYEILQILLDDLTKKNLYWPFMDEKAFSLACEKGNLEIVKLLLKYEEVTSTVKYLEDSEGNIPFHFACKSGNLETVKFFTEDSMVELNAPNKLGRTPFHMACEHGKLEVVKHLIQSIDYDVVDDNGSTSFHFACQSGNLELMKYFVEQTSIDLNAKNKFGQIPFLWVDNRGKDLDFDTAPLIEVMKIAEYFIEKSKTIDIDLNSPSIKGSTFLSLFKERVSKAGHKLSGEFHDRVLKIICDLKKLENGENLDNFDMPPAKKLKVSLRRLD